MADPRTKGVAHASRKVGISEDTGYQWSKQPHVRNMITDAFEEEGVTPKDIAQPVIDGLKACESVNTEQGKTVTDCPDHKTRLQAHDRAVHLYGLGARHHDDIPKQAPQPIFNFIRVEAPEHASQRKDPETVPPAMTATFTREEGP